MSSLAGFCLVGLLISVSAQAKLKSTTADQVGNLQSFAIQSYFLKQVLGGLDASGGTIGVDKFLKVVEVIQDYHFEVDNTVVIPRNFDSIESSVQQAVSTPYSTLIDELQYSNGLEGKTDIRNLHLIDKGSQKYFAKIKSAFEKYELPISLEIIDAPRFWNHRAEIEYSIRVGEAIPPRREGERDYFYLPQAPRFFSEVLCSPTSEAAQWRQNILHRPYLNREVVKDFLQSVSSLLQIQLVELQSISDKILQSGDIKFEKAADQRFFELIIRGYFSEIPHEKAKDVLKAMIERPDRTSTKDIFRLIVLHSDPYIQKLFQAVARRPGFSPELQEIFAELEDGGLPVPWDKMKRALARPPIGYKWVELEPTPWVGTMAQTYPGKVRGSDGEIVEIVARVLKNPKTTAEELPAAKARMLAIAKTIDSDPILRAAHFPRIQPMVEDVVSWAEAELDASLTRKNQKTGAKSYSSQVTVDGLTVKFLSPITLRSSNPEVIFSTRIRGDKFPDFAAKYLKQAVTVAEEIAKKWAETAMFGNLFFHGDLHPGNLKVKLVNSNTVHVGFFDYGIAGTLRPEHPSLFARLELATHGKAPSHLIAKYIWLLSDPARNAVTFESLTEQVAKHRRSKDKPNDAIGWLTWALSIGFVLEENINILIRGYQTVESLLLISGSKRTFTELNLEVGMKHMNEAMTILAQAAEDRRRGCVALLGAQK